MTQYQLHAVDRVFQDQLHAINRVFQENRSVSCLVHTSVNVIVHVLCSTKIAVRLENLCVSVAFWHTPVPYLAASYIAAKKCSILLPTKLPVLHKQPQQLSNMMGIAVSWLQFLFPDMGYSKPARAGWARIHLGSSLPRHVNSERHQNPSNSDTDFDDGSVAADDLLTFDSISSSGEGNLFEECSDTWNDARGNDTKPPTSARGLVDDAIVDDDDDDVGAHHELSCRCTSARDTIT